jgi:hypothetical protein
MILAGGIAVDVSDLGAVANECNRFKAVAYITGSS